MLRVLLTVLAALFFFASSTNAFNWSRNFEQMRFSVVSVFHLKGSCTAFSINQKHAYYLTAAHCLGEDIALWKEQVPGLVAVQGRIDVKQVTLVNKQKDIAVLEGVIGLPSVVRGKASIGQEVASIGYAYGENRPFILASIISQIREARAYDTTRIIILRDNVDIGGMSGGPVINTRGQVIAMVQQVNRNLSWGTAIEDIYQLTKLYWEN